MKAETEKVPDEPEASRSNRKEALNNSNNNNKTHNDKGMLKGHRNQMKETRVTKDGTI